MYCRAYNYLVKTGNVKNISDAHLILLCIKSAYDMHVCIPITTFFFHFINLARLLKYKAALSPFLVTSFY